MEDKNPAEELAFIKEIIQQSRKTNFITGVEYILWGVIVPIGLIGTYLLIDFHLYSLIRYLWVLIICAGWGFEIFHIIKTKKREKTKSYVTKSISALWTACGIAIMIISFIGLFASTNIKYDVSPLIAIILGIAYFVSGTLLEYKWLRNIGFVWWIAGIYFFLCKDNLNLLIFALLLLVLQAGSGLILNRKTAKYDE